MVQISLTQSPSIKTKLKINNKLIMSIKMLQMSYEELQNFIKKEAEKNPFIILKKNKYQNELNYEDKFNKGIKEWIYQQSSILNTNPIKEKLIETYIENLDDNGFCRISSNEAAQLSKCSLTEAINVLEQLKTLDPPGIFSQNLEELLTFQIIKKYKFNKYYKIIIDNLNLVASHNIKKLSSLCELEEYKIEEMIEKIKNCKPRPLDSLNNEKIQNIIPDIIIEIHNKKIQLKMNTNNQYQIYLNEKYINKIKLQSKLKSRKETQIFIREHISHSNWLKNNLNKRNKTLILVAKKIFNYQKEYFFSGQSGILPLTHKNISKMINIHESTVSRAVKNKFIKFDNKTIPINYFFSSKIKNSDTSSKSIKNKIREIIYKNNNKYQHLSDQKITNILNKSGIMISRRTVTKYRISEEIPNSQIRLRRYKN